MPSTAVCTTISSSPTRSRPAANDSPTRRIASCRRARSRWRSSSRASSCRAIELNSLPSAANSSLPSAGTVTEKSPRPSRCAATSRRWISDCRRRETATAKTKASTRKPTKAAAAASEVRRRRGRARVGEQQPDRKRAADRGGAERLDAVVGPVDLGGALRGQVGRRGGPCRATRVSPSSTTTRPPVSFSIRLANSSADSMATVRRPVGSPCSSSSRRPAGAMAGGCRTRSAPSRRGAARSTRPPPGRSAGRAGAGSRGRRWPIASASP